MGILTIGEIEIQCDFNTKDIQSELDGVIVSSKLLGYEVLVKDSMSVCSLSIYNPKMTVDYCHVAFFSNIRAEKQDSDDHFKTWREFNTANFHNLTKAGVICRNTVDFMNCIEILKKSITEVE